MEKKNQGTSQGNEAKASTSAQMIFGANMLQINGDDASGLIGSIIEKGISENLQSKLLAPTPPPKVTVLPFPVARHRSHGPHWGPMRSEIAVNDDNEDDEDNDSTEINSMSAFANPVQMRQKKGLDLSQWRGLIPSDSPLESSKMEGNRLKLKSTGKQNKDGVVDNKDKKNISWHPPLVDKTPMEVDADQDLSSFVPPTKKGAMSSDIDTGSLTPAADMEIYNSHQVHVEENIRNASSILSKSKSRSIENMPNNGIAKLTQLEKKEKVDPAFGEMLIKRGQKASTMVSSSSLSNFGKERGSLSLESEIDTENRARLKSMSPEEIAEAQAEIMEKMDPALVNLLKKRGQEKSKQQYLSRSDKPISNELNNTLSEIQTAKSSEISSHVRSDSSDMMTITTSTDTKIGPDNGLVQDSGPHDGYLWNSWSERVEAVRRLRFSLEGSVITDESEAGDISIDTRDGAVNVTERDFLRTEGDPGAVGYTIKEAVQLTRSVIPGQRALALHLLASVLDKAIHNIQQNQVGCTIKNVNLVDKLIDWEAIWAYALGPEPELVLSLRMCLDDNHSSVVLACARVIQCALSCDLNENFFDILEKIAFYEKHIFTGPVFRSKPDINVGFLHGGFWKYNAKPSNVLTFTDDVIDDETEGKHTIQDDIFFAGQDFAAGLVRMGILPRLHYLLEADTNAALEECIISILVAIARHSPTCANAIMKCQGLVHTVVHKFTMGFTTEIHASKIKSVSLLKVLAQSDKKNCSEFIKTGSFHAMIQHLFRYTSSLDHWVKSGKESCKLSSALMVEQLRFWRVCISFGLCMSYFSDIFPALCLWLHPPTFSKLQENNVLSEFVSISREAYLVLEALVRKLPSFYSQKHISNQISDCASDELETWSWSFVTPVIDLALQWIASKDDPYVSNYFGREKGIGTDFVFEDSSDSSLLWVFSAVMHMLSALLEKVKPEETLIPQGSSRHVPWLPEFVSKVGLEIIRNQFLSINGTEEQKDFDESGTWINELCCFRQHSKNESSLASVCCLHGLFQVIISIDNLISLAKGGICVPLSQGYNFSSEGKILEDGILKRSLVEWRCVLNVFMKLVGSEWHFMQSIEIFGRGGPAPGVGLGWGASGGGFWSMTVLLAQTDARLIIYMLEIIQMVSSTESPTNEEMVSAMHRVNSVLGACLTIGPTDRVMMEKALDILLQVPVLRYLDLCVQHFLLLNKRMKPFRWEYKKEDYFLFSEILASHFKNRWLSVKKKLKAIDTNNSFQNGTSKKGNVSLETIHEDLETSNMPSQVHYCTSLMVEWAHQRLPLPMHWFLSPISTISDDKHAGLQNASSIPNLIHDSSVLVEVAKGGLFLLLAMEAMSTFLSNDVHSPIRNVPLVWKLHSLSVILLVGMDVLDDNKGKNVYEALQDIYGHILDEVRFTKSAKHILDESANLLLDTEKKCSVDFMRFQSVIHESYSTFLETLVEQFAAVSYGDLIFGRQVSVYLHRCTEAAVRLSAWNALSNAHVLEILPPLEECIAEAEGYLEPIEDNEGILEAYVKSWISGALDRSAARGSMAFALVLHHLSSFIFLVRSHDNTSLRNKIVKSLLRDYSQKQKHEGMMLELVQYCKPSKSHQPGECSLLLQNSDIEKRFQVLTDACDRNSSLLAEVEKLRSAFVKKLDAVK
ncbi:hypothetical protein P3X46_000782 [Hevea brasiliensis]|uniref:RNA polymerase II-associated protein 1 N-terminal domain-containing protein n=1 Tax=Hevea brasiliensis TaxID=3981 RepID=A0ABQ9NAR2_HEVBR|nr:transcriptional elongation regulator MINIYO [Hevea brasiliensis]KAJ9189497.1 hypothetical protein P3X46_000782 [Hevea brasiliensis]